MLALLRPARIPSRNPAQNLADLRAQIAANEKGVQELRKMVGHFGLAVVHAYMRHVQDNAEESVRRVITRAARRRVHAARWTTARRITVAITRRSRSDRSAVIDFTGTSAQLPNNFNAPPAVCMAAVLYVFRTLVDDDIPLNAGCLKPLRGDHPARLDAQPALRRPRWSPATSRPRSCITNALYGALGVMAAAQGTMNNFTFGNDALPVLRDDLRRLRRRAAASTAPTSCRRT